MRPVGARAPRIEFSGIEVVYAFIRMSLGIELFFCIKNGVNILQMIVLAVRVPLALTADFTARWGISALDGQ